jgi:hypothetical protein
MANARYFRRKAGQCHRLAAEVLSRSGAVILELNALSIEFAAQATGLEDHGQFNPLLDLPKGRPSAAIPPTAAQ